MRFSLFVMAAAIVANTVAAVEGRGPTLVDASGRAEVIAFGQVERLERRAGRSIATMRVEYVGRGEPREWITFLAEPIGEYEPSASVGKRMLVFLESTGQDPSMKIAFNGRAVLSAFDKGGERYVATTNDSHRLQLPENLCDPRVKFGLYGCSAKLSTVLRQAGLPPIRLQNLKHGTFRVVTRQCEPCELEPWVLQSTTSTATDCGSGTIDGANSFVVQCVGASVTSGEPFKVLLPKSGIDSKIVNAFTSDGRQAYELGFDSSIEGGGDCSARVSRWPCRSLDIHASDQDLLKCVDRGHTEALCSQYDSRVETLTAPRNVSDLRCEAGEHAAYFSCVVLPHGPRARKVIPSSRGPTLLCYSFGDLTDLAECHPD